MNNESVAPKAKRTRRRGLGRLTAGISLGLVVGIAVPVSATTVTSNTKYFSNYGGITYSNRASAENAGTYSSFKTDTMASQSRPPGNLTGRARLYKYSSIWPNWSLCEQTSWVHSNVSTTSWWVQGRYGGSAYNGECGDGTFRSQGRSGVYLGNEYFYSDTYNSPNISMID